MKKILLILILMILTSPLMFSFDWGGNISNYSYATNEDDSYDQVNKFSLWGSHSFDDFTYFTGQGSIGYAKDDYDFLADLDYLYFDQSIPEIFGESSALSYRIGRFYQSEFTGKVFAHRADGLFVNLGIPAGNLHLSTGYTGLLLKPVSDLNTTAADIADDDDDDIHFAPKKLVSVLGFDFIDILPGQQLNISGVSVFDLRSDDLIEDGDTSAGENTGGKLNTFYIGAGLGGGISSSVFYDIYGYMQLGKTLTNDGVEYSYESISAFLGGGSLSWFSKQLLYSKATASFVYASGDDDSSSLYEGNTEDSGTTFIPVSGTSTGFIFAPDLSNIMIAGLEYSIKPFGNEKGMISNLQTLLSANMFFRATEGAISEQGIINTASDDKYLGTEIDLGINFRPFSDFGVGLKGGIFMPPTGSDSAVNEDSNDPEFGGSVNLSFSF